MSEPQKEKKEFLYSIISELIHEHYDFPECKELGERLIEAYNREVPLLMNQVLVLSTALLRIYQYKGVSMAEYRHIAGAALIKVLPNLLKEKKKPENLSQNEDLPIEKE